MHMEPLPKSEVDLLTVLLKLPYQKRIGYGLRLVNNHRNDPALLLLIQELLSTTLLPDRVPFPGKEEGDDYITLSFPQSTASKRFFQRELGLAMAEALGQPGIPFLLDAIIHPSTAGKSHATTACASVATDRQLVEVYQHSVPAVQETLREAMVAAGRVESLKLLHLWQEPPPAKIVEPCCVILERDLKAAKPRDRDAVWTRARLSYVRPHRRLHDPLYVHKDSKVDLVTILFDLLELYPPLQYSKQLQTVPSIPSSLDGRLHSFLKCDISRTLRLIRSTCHVPEHEGGDLLKLPSSFMHQKASSRFWHMLPLEGQKEHLLPFILDLMRIQNQVLLKNGQLRFANLLQHARWQIIIAVAKSALESLENAQTVQAMPIPDRNGIMAFVVHAVETLTSRLHHIAHRKDLLTDQMEIESELGNLLRLSVERILGACRVSASSDEAFVKNFMQGFILPLLRGQVNEYPPLVEVLFDSIKGVFDITQVSKSELVSTASLFLRALRTRRLSVFDIPNDGVVQPYCGVRDTDNDAVFRLLLQLEHPRDNPSFYVNSVLDALSEQQKEVIWTYFNDPGYVCRRLFDDGGLQNRAVFVKILTELPTSPGARLPIVRAVLDHPKVDGCIAAEFYPLLDISDVPSRELLQKNTYTRLFADRYRAYKHLMTATWARESPKEYIITLRFLIARIKNEILPDAGQIPEILDKNGVSSVLRLLDQATDDEVKELAELYLAWEKQNNEAISRVIFISDYILSLATSALTHFAGSPAHPAFHFGMDLLWAREVFKRGPLNAHKTYYVQVSTTEPKLNEDEELKRRQFMLDSKDALGKTGYWRISDERQFVDTLLKQHQKVQQAQPFERSNIYPVFISSMLGLLGTRWATVPALREYTKSQLDVVRGIAGSNKSPADWNGKAQREAVQYVLSLRGLYDDAKVTSENLSWWSEFRHLRLFSTDASVEVDFLVEETYDSEGKQIQDKLDKLVEKLLGIDDSAVHLEFVLAHLMENRQDLLKDSHITSTSAGLFNQLSKDVTPQPPSWKLTFPRRLYPRQCEVFAAKLLETIHSGEVPLSYQVEAAGQLTKLPTTTIIELAELLKEDLNRRVIEAILMFLPHLDEPASGIQFLLAPAYLDGDLARTVVFSVRNALQHVPASSLPQILIPVFPPEHSKRFLKITVMKELVRLVCQHISHEEHQTFLMTLWRRTLHQDVRIALLQSVLFFLGSRHESLGWVILRDAVSNPALVLDDALIALLAVHPSSTNLRAHVSDVQVTSISDPDILIDMAQSTIPSECHEAYTEDVLYPLSQLSFDVPKTFPNLGEKEGKLVHERLCLLQQSAYHRIFSDFITVSNAHLFAQRGLDAAKNVVPSDVQGADLFPYFVYGIGECIALDPQCWEVLCQLVDFLGRAVGSPGREPTKTSLNAIRRLQGMNLGSNMTFQRPESIRKRLTVDRMTLLEPLVGCDHFAVTSWERRFYLFSCDRGRVSSDEVLPLELDEARSLLFDLIRLSGALQYDLAHLKSKTTSLIDTASTSVADTLVDDLLSGSHGLDGVWINELRLLVLSHRVRLTLHHARALAAFQTQVSTYHKSFYAQHWQTIDWLVVSFLMSNSKEKVPNLDLVAILLDPILERAESSAWDLHILDRLYGNGMLDHIPDVILSHRPRSAIERIHTRLFSLHPWEVGPSTLHPAVILVEFVNTIAVFGKSTDDKAAKCSDFSPLTALLVDAIYSGHLRNFDLGRLITNGAKKTEPVLLYPYFVTDQDDGSGGDIENRRSKATVPQLVDRYHEWKAAHASQYLSSAHQPQILPSVRPILQEILEPFPQLALVHPSLFFSYAAVTFGQSDLDAETRIESVLSHLRKALQPSRERESGTRWGWAPPLSLTLSFAQILLTETPNEVAETVLDDHGDMGSVTCKLAALELLEWWTKTFYGAFGSDESGLRQLVESMERAEGRESLMRSYDELRALACRDECRVVREKAFVLPSANRCTQF